MHWIAPSEKDTETAALEKRLWDAADQFRANSGLKSQEYSAPVLGLIFLRFAEVRFAAQRSKLEKSATSSRRGSRVDEPAAYHAEGILYLPAEARFDYLLIHKFQTAELLCDRPDVIVLTDEAHRSQYDTLALNMRAALPKALFLAFTGTPLIAGEERTKDVFGDYVSIYDFQQSVQDGATVPLFYENRTPDGLVLSSNDGPQAPDCLFRIHWLATITRPVGQTLSNATSILGC